MNLLPQFGFFELAVVAAVALIVVGPKDLPRLMRTVGQMVSKARRMAGEFMTAFDQMTRETEMEEMRSEIDALKNDNVFAEAKRDLKDSLNPVKDSLNPIDDAIRDEAMEVKDALSAPVSRGDGGAANDEPSKS